MAGKKHPPRAKKTPKPAPSPAAKRWHVLSMLATAVPGGVETLDKLATLTPKPATGPNAPAAP